MMPLGLPEDALAFRAGRNPVSRAAGQEKPYCRRVIRRHHGRAEDGLREVKDLGVEGPPVRISLVGHPFG